MRLLKSALIGSLLILPLFAQGQGSKPVPKPSTDSNSFLENLQKIQAKYQNLFENKFGFQLDFINNPMLFGKVAEWMGTPYRYRGGSRRGINCSNFVSMLYSYLYNIDLQGSSKEIFKEYVVPIPKDDLQESDLIFFKIRKQNISHIGIYLGNNKFAHATLGKGVTISDLDENYYKKYFFSAGRVKDFFAIPLCFIHF